MLYVEKVRKYARELPVPEAVTLAVDESIREGILAEFLKRYRAEAIEVSIFEYDEEVHMGFVREEGRAEGEWKKLISQVHKKLEKGLTAIDIADMLEEDLPVIWALIELIEKNPDKSEEELARLYLS